MHTYTAAQPCIHRELTLGIPHTNLHKILQQLASHLIKPAEIPEESMSNSCKMVFRRYSNHSGVVKKKIETQKIPTIDQMYKQPKRA